MTIYIFILLSYFGTHFALSREHHVEVVFHRSPGSLYVHAKEWAVYSPTDKPVWNFSHLLNGACEIPDHEDFNRDKVG